MDCRSQMKRGPPFPALVLQAGGRCGAGTLRSSGALRSWVSLLTLGRHPWVCRFTSPSSCVLYGPLFTAPVRGTLFSETSTVVP